MSAGVEGERFAYLVLFFHSQGQPLLYDYLMARFEALSRRGVALSEEEWACLLLCGECLLTLSEVLSWTLASWVDVLLIMQSSSRLPLSEEQASVAVQAATSVWQSAPNQFGMGVAFAEFLQWRGGLESALRSALSAVIMFWIRSMDSDLDRHEVERFLAERYSDRSPLLASIFALPREPTKLSALNAELRAALRVALGAGGDNARSLLARLPSEPDT